MTGVNGAELQRVRQSAEQALASGLAGVDSAIRQRGRLLEPVPITAPDGTRAGWLVGFAVGDTLVGLIQLTADTTFHRYASFQRRPTDTQGCPAVRTWFDPATIHSQARSLVGSQAQLAQPVLSFDLNPDRLVWVVAAVQPDGHQTTINVAGEYAYQPPAP